jgi:hypothetical protein
MSSARDWLNSALTLTTETKQSAAEWSKTAAEHELAMSRFKRPTSLEEIDSLTKLGDSGNSDGNSESLPQSPRLKGPINPITPILPATPPHPTKSGGKQPSAKKLRKQSLKNQAVSQPPPLKQASRAPRRSSDFAFKTTVALDGVLHSVALTLSPDDVLIEATDSISAEVHKAKHKVKNSVISAKSQKDLNSYFDQLCKRLSFRRADANADKASAAPRFMQSTGNVTKKLVVLPKTSDGGGGAGGTASALSPPFFKSRLPIGDIVADVGASHSADDVVVRFYDSIYNVTTDFIFPACALSSLSDVDFKALIPKSKAQASGLGLEKKAALGSALPPSAASSVSAQAVKNLCQALTILREEDGNGNVCLSTHAPQFVTKYIAAAVQKASAAVTVQGCARKYIEYNRFKPKLFKMRQERAAVKRIQARARGNHTRLSLRRRKLEFRGAKKIQTLIRMCLARSEVQDLRGRCISAIKLQTRARMNKSRQVAEARREVRLKEAAIGAATLLQNRIRICLASSELDDRRANNQAAVKLQSRARMNKSRQVTEVKRQARHQKVSTSAATLLQTRIRVCLASALVQDLRYRHAAATRLQTRARIKQSCKATEVKRTHKRAADEEAARQKQAWLANLQENSAQLLQTRLRMHQSRKVVQHVRLKNHSAMLLQTRIRGVLARDETQDRRKRKQAAIILQSSIRQNLARQNFDQRRAQRDAVTLIQSKTRQRQARVVFGRLTEKKENLQLYCAFRLQKHVRRFIAVMRVKKLRLRRIASTRIQTRIRICLAKEAVEYKRQTRLSALRIQTRIRVCLARDRVQEQRSRRFAATKIQSSSRQRRARYILRHRQHVKQNELLHSSALRIQRQERKRQAVLYVAELRRIRDNILDMKLKLKKHKSSITIQRVARQKLARNRVASRRVELLLAEERSRLQYQSARGIQTRIRMCLAKEELVSRRDNRHAAIRIQARIGRVIVAINGVKRRREFLFLSNKSATRIQCVLCRGRKGRAVATRRRLENTSAIKIQCVFRSQKAASKVHSLKAKLAEEVVYLTNLRATSAVAIQLAIRQCLARMVVSDKREERGAAVRIQQAARSRQARRIISALRLQRSAATRIQTIGRGCVTRGRWIKLLEQHNCAIYIQTLVRIAQAKEILKVRRAGNNVLKWNMAIKICCLARRGLARWKVEEMKEARAAAVAIQKTARRRNASVKFSIALKSIVIIQSLGRRRAGVQFAEWHRQWKAWEEVCAVKIQAVARGCARRNEMKQWDQYWHEYAKAAVIQARVRGISVRRYSYFGGVPRRPKSPVYFTWVRHYRKELLEECIHESKRMAIFGREESASSLAVNFDMEVRNKRGDSLFGVAASVGWGEGLSMLKEMGADVNCKNKAGNTAAHKAFAAGWDDIGYYLVDDCGVDDSVLNGEGLDCYELSDSAKEEKRPDMYLGDGPLGSDIKEVAY